MFLNPNPNNMPVISKLEQERRVFIADQHAIQNLAELLAILLRKLNPQRCRQPVVLAIGTDRSTGDSLGPLVGTWLNELTSGLLPCLRHI